MASRTCAFASPRPRRRRRSPRPCRWWRPPSCAARRRRRRRAPYSPSAWSTVLGNIASAVAGSDSAPRLLAGTGSDKVHLLVVCTAERGLCGAFNSSIVVWRASTPTRCWREGKEIKIFCVGQQGLRAAPPQVRQADHRSRRAARAVKQLGFGHAADGRRQDRRSCSTTASSTSARCSFALQVGDLADPDRAADDPAGVRTGGAERRRCRRSTNTSRTRTKSSPTCCRATVGADLPRAAGKRRVRAGRADERDGQRHPQRRRQ